MSKSLKPTFFPTPAAFRAWLKKNHKTADELIVGYYRKDCGKPSITWQESVDEALCFGWIDGIRQQPSAGRLLESLHAAASRQQLERHQHQRASRS